MVGSVLLITLVAFEELASTSIMPSVVADLGAERWFSLASGAALAAQLAATVVAGLACDWRGPRFVMAWGLALFTSGLVVSALAGTISVFVVGRLMMGLGGGLLIVPLYVLIGSVADAAHRPAFFASFSLAWVVPSLVGPVIAGYVVRAFGWHPVFGFVPLLTAVAVLPLVGILRGLTHPPSPRPPKLWAMACTGAVAGTGAALIQLAGALDPAWRSVVVAVFAAGIAMCAWSLPRLLPRGAFTLRRGIGAGVMARLLAMGVQAGAGVFIPLLLQRIHGWPEHTATLWVSAGSLAWAAGAVIQSRVKSPGGRSRLPLAGTVLLAAGVASLAALLTPAVPLWVALAGWMAAGLGTGLFHSSLSVLALEITPAAKHGKVASWLQVADSAGPAIELASVSVLMGVWADSGATGALAYAPAYVVAVVLACAAVAASRRIA